MNQSSAASPQRQAFDVILLREINRNGHDANTRVREWRSDGQPADLLCCRQIALEQCWRETRHTDVIETIAGVVLREQRKDIDVECQQVPNGVLVLASIETTKRRRPSGIGIR